MTKYRLAKLGWEEKRSNRHPARHPRNQEGHQRPEPAGERHRYVLPELRHGLFHVHALIVYGSTSCEASSRRSPTASSDHRVKRDAFPMMIGRSSESARWASPRSPSGAFALLLSLPSSRPPLDQERRFLSQPASLFFSRSTSSSATSCTRRSTRESARCQFR